MTAGNGRLGLQKNPKKTRLEMSPENRDMLDMSIKKVNKAMALEVEILSDEDMELEDNATFRDIAFCK